MNILAFLFALSGAGLNLVMPIVMAAGEKNVSISESVSGLVKWFTDFFSSDSFFLPIEVKSIVVLVLAIPVIAVISGLFVLARKKESFFAKILALCACPYLFMAYSYYEQIESTKKSSILQFFTSGDAVSVMSDMMYVFLSWGLCYGLSAAFAYFDSIHMKHIEEVRSSDEIKRLREDNETLKKILAGNNHESESPEEKKYSEAINADTEAQRSRNIESMKKAAELFDELGDYKDSRLKAEAIRKQIMMMKEARTNILRIIISAVIVGLFIGGIILFDKIIHM